MTRKTLVYILIFFTWIVNRLFLESDELWVIFKIFTSLMFIEFVNTRRTTTNNWFPTTCHLRYKVLNKNEIKMRSEDGLSFNGIVALYFWVFDGLLNLCKIWYTLITIYTLIYIYGQHSQIWQMCTHWGRIFEHIFVYIFVHCFIFCHSFNI